MKLTTRTRYGTRMMVELAKHYHQGPMRLNEIARRQALPVKYLEQIVMPLKDAGLIKSIRGVRGGHMLGRSPEEITVYDIMKVLEGDAIAPCSQEFPECERLPYCETKVLWQRINEKIIEELKNTTLAKLIEQGGGRETNTKQSGGR